MKRRLREKKREEIRKTGKRLRKESPKKERREIKTAQQKKEGNS